MAGTADKEKRVAERVAQCDIVIGYDVENEDVYVIKDTVTSPRTRTGRVGLEHAIKRLRLAALKAALEWECRADNSIESEGMDDDDEA